jgi:membrane protein
MRFGSLTQTVEIARKTLFEVNDDNCLGLSAQLAFYFFLALFPALLFLVALIGSLPLEDALSELLATLSGVAPGEVLSLLRRQIDDISGGSHGSLLTIGIAGAVWSSSAAMVAIIEALNRAYDIEEFRPWWKRRLIAISLTVALTAFIVMALAMVLVGPNLAFRLATSLGLDRIVGVAWTVMRWPLIVLLVILGVDLVYHFAPNRRRRWKWITPGSVLATALWISGSFGFKFYISTVTDFNATYGAIGGVAVMMLWFYVSGLAILVGAELNAVIESLASERPVSQT